MAIEGASRPITKKQVRSFLGLEGFYRAFIPNFSQIAAPLMDLTKKGKANKVRWGDPQQNASDALKKALVMQPILRMADLSQPFILQVQLDASNNGLEAVLLQEEEGKKSPVANASRTLKTSEKAYAVIEKEYRFHIVAIRGSENVGADYLSRA